MLTFDKLRKIENLHILLWLIKDCCWMMEWRLPGIIMIAPTFFLALYMVVKTFSHSEFLVNLAVFFWISANSYWMIVEFYFNDAHKHLAMIPFVCGLFCVSLYYFKTIRARSSTP